MQRFTKAIAAILLIMVVFIAAGCTKSDDINSHDYVDLGLPSGILWATYNVGADTPEDYGDYFAWGETEPKECYNWSTYQYCNGSHNTLTKYCGNSEYGYKGYTDKLTILQSKDDAATANWGRDWHMPTYRDWVELYDNTTCTWTVRNGVGGRLFTASNGNNLFLPAAGDWGNAHEYAGIGGFYWSSSFYMDYPDGAMDFIFDSHTDCYVSCFERSHGRSVRAVRFVAKK